MNIFTWIKEKLGFGEYDFDDIEIGDFDGESAESLMDSLAKSSKRRRNIDVHDGVAREQYVRDCCEMMSSASKDVEKQKSEYQKVLHSLADLDEIDSLPMHDRSLVKLQAKKIVKIEDDEEKYVRPSRKITEAQYHQMEQLEDEIPDILKKLKADEEYQMIVRRDLNLLEGEKGAIAYQRKEERNKVRNARSWALVVIFAAAMAAVLLLIVHKSIRIDIQMGLVILAACFALALTAVFVSFTNAQREITRANRKLNKTILLQNTVKIKYVNITNVLDYNYAKYGIMNSHELGYMWEKFQEEKASRLHDSDVEERLSAARRELYQVLKHYHITDPSALVYNPRVLTDPKEEESTRHEMIVMRQRLKKGIDFEIYNLENAKKEIESLVKEYPQYAQQILGIVSQYEG